MVSLAPAPENPTRKDDQEIARTEIMQAPASFAFRASNAGITWSRNAVRAFLS